MNGETRSLYVGRSDTLVFDLPLTHPDVEDASDSLQLRPHRRPLRDLLYAHALSALGLSSSPAPSSHSHVHPTMAMADATSLIAWHAWGHYVAVSEAAHYEVFLFNTREKTWVQSLTHQFQRYVYTMAWSKTSTSMLAVGVSSGILLWNLFPDPDLSFKAWATFLQHPHCKPVTGLQFCPMGRFLLASSSTDTCLYVWDVVFRTPIPISGNSSDSLCSRAVWSFDGTNVVRGDANGYLSVYITERWAFPSRIRMGAGCVTGLVWLGAQGDVCVASFGGSASLQSIAVSSQLYDHDVIRAPGLELDMSGLEMLFEGLISTSVAALCADPTRTYIAVSFHHGNPTSASHVPKLAPCVCIYTVTAQPFLSATLTEVIQKPDGGELDPLPIGFSFSPQVLRSHQAGVGVYVELCVLWSDRRISLYS